MIEQQALDIDWGEDITSVLDSVSKKKTKTKKTTKVEIPLSEQMKNIEKKVLARLGNQQDNIQVIYNKNELLEYLDKGLNLGIISIDTETNNTIDYLSCKLMGLCLYVPDEKQVYVPVNHIDINTKERLTTQLTELDIADCLNYVIENKGDTQFIYHNGKFDLEVIQTTCGVKMPIDWDTQIAAQMLDENEVSFGLKQQYIDKIDPLQEKYSIEELFEGIPYEYFDPKLFSYYAATDAMLTYKLYEYQLNQFFEDSSLDKVYEIYKEVELPIIPIIIDMELRGVQFDNSYSETLKTKYHTLLETCEQDIQNEISKYQDEIDRWRLTPDANKPTKTISGNVGKTKNELLSDPILLTSPQQLAILFYDILKEPIIDKSSPRGTGEKIIAKMNNSIAQKMTTEREFSKLVKSFIDTLPNEVKADGKIHCEFNQLGARTGRFSSENPNMQQIPSHNKELRMLFKGSERLELVEKDSNSFVVPLNNWVYIGDRWECVKNLKVGTTIYENKGSKNTYTIISTQSLNSKIKILVSETDSKTLYTKVRYILVSSDFSQQEPRLLSQFSQDENMIGAYQKGKDLYATIASDIYHNNYEDNLEFYADGTPNPEGKTRRARVKSLLLGIMYGRGKFSIAEELKISPTEAQHIIDSFYVAYPKVKKWIDGSKEFAKKNEYSEDLWGRRRRLPNINLPKVEIKENNSINFNPFLVCEDRTVKSQKYLDYEKRVEKAKSKKEIEKISQEASKDGITIIDNSGLIAEAERQSVNARIQGSAATMTKKAMIKIYNDKRLQDLDFHLLLVVHDEIIGECPYENADMVSEILCDDMRNCLKDDKRIDFKVPFKCDPDISFNWYWNDYINSIKTEYKEFKESGEKDPFMIIKNNHTEINENILKENLSEFLC